MANVSSFSGAMPVIPGGEVEVARVTRTSGDYTVNQTSIANAANIFSSNLTWVADGGSYIVEFYSPAVGSATGANSTTVVSLVTSAGTDLGIIGQSGLGDGSRDRRAPMLTRFWYTPSAGSVSINARAIYWNSGNGFIAGGAGGAGTNMPAYLRVVKPVNQNDGLKPFWTPPVVTQLPSQATVGDQVIYAADATNGVYWHLQYDGLGTYPWKFIGGPALVSTADGSGTTTSTTYTTSLTGASNAGPSLTIALPGDYDVAYGAGQVGQNTNDKVAYMAVGTGTPGSSIDWVRIYTWATNNATYFNRVDVSMHASRRLTGLAGASTLAAYYKVNTGATATFGDRYMNVTPVRVKAA